jgi:hypothetical protein
MADLRQLDQVLAVRAEKMHDWPPEGSDQGWNVLWLALGTQSTTDRGITARLRSLPTCNIPPLRQYNVQARRVPSVPCLRAVSCVFP